MATSDVALLGTGKMGTALVGRWVDAGRTVTVWNRTPERARALAGPHVHVETDLASAARSAPVVVSILTDGEALRHVLLDLGAVAAMPEGSTLVDLSTVDVASSRAVSAAAAERGVRYVRGGVSGTAAVVGSGAAGLLLSATRDALDAARPVLDDVTTRQVVVGEDEEARVVKLAVNMLLAGTTQVLAEAVVMAEASGVPRETVLDAMDSTVMSSKFLSYKGGALRSRDYATTFRTDDLRKDVRLALEQAASVGVTMPVMDGVHAQLDAACDRGWADDDFLVLTRLVQQQAGRPVDGDAVSRS
jgi:3-hydroxyisobutyrate dehydrogenase-like beta-hydroxyacid dehydrogenase